MYIYITIEIYSLDNWEAITYYSQNLVELRGLLRFLMMQAVQRDRVGIREAIVLIQRRREDNDALLSPKFASSLRLGILH